MKHHQEPSTHEVLAGLVERVTFHNADSGFCVLRISPATFRSSGKSATAVGATLNASKLGGVGHPASQRTPASRKPPVGHRRRFWISVSIA
jgi:hypothetical protein